MGGRAGYLSRPGFSARRSGRCVRLRFGVGWTLRPAAVSARVMEWQTWGTQNPLLERACGFESHLGYDPLLRVSLRPEPGW